VSCEKGPPDIFKKCRPRPAAANPTQRLIRVCTLWKSSHQWHLYFLLFKQFDYVLVFQHRKGAYLGLQFVKYPKVSFRMTLVICFVLQEKDNCCFQPDHISHSEVMNTVNINSFDWNCLTVESLNGACDLCTASVINLVKQCIPSKKITVRNDDQLWYDSLIRNYSKRSLI